MAEERRAEREAKRAEKRAKEAEKKAKRFRWEAERQALVDEYKTKFQELGAKKRHSGSRAEAVDLWVTMQSRMRRKAYLNFDEGLLECTDLLVEFDLAYVENRSGGPYVRYADRRGYLWKS